MRYSISSTVLWCAVYILFSTSMFMVEAGDDYCQVLQKSLLFYEANRAGRLPSTNRIPWRGNSVLGDCTSPCTTDANGDGNLVGGYFDAGDHVKFGLPMAWTTTTLAWALIEYEDAVNACGELDHYLDTIKWATDYFIKAHIAPNEFVAQVGNGGIDHSYWGPPEIMKVDRPVYTISASSPGTEVAMETAAALAAAYIIFNGRAGYDGYSTTLLSHARQLFTFGDTYRGTYSDSVTDAASYYKSWSGYNDEIVWAAAWLYKATGETAFLTRAKNDYTTFALSGQISGQSFDWDNKAPGVAVLLAKLTSAAPYTDDAQKFVSWWKPGGGVTYTPGGLAWIRQWGPNRYAANAAFLASLVNNDGIKWAQTQISYMLGNNPLKRSFLCGYGTNPPINPHHRAAHGSTTGSINDPVNNLHILNGALVGGPDSSDVYVDDRTDYIKNEVATDYNAGFTATVVALAAYSKASPSGGGSNVNPPVAGTTAPTQAPESTSAPATSAPTTQGATNAPATGTPTAAPTTAPSSGSSTATVLYSDSFGSGVQDWSWASHNAQATTLTHGGSKYSISFEPTSWGGVFLKCDNCVDSSKHSGVEFYVAGGANSGQKIRAYLVTAENGSTNQVGDEVPVAVESDWKRIFLDASKATKAISGVIIQDVAGVAQSTVYIDDVAVLSK